MCIGFVHWRQYFRIVNPTFSQLAATLQQPPPWLLPHLPLALQVLHAANSQPLADALNSVQSNDGPTIRFVEHAALPRHEAYEAFVFRTGCVPTRDDVHDLFNGLMWLCYPKTKRRLNQLQAQEIARRGTTGPRGALRDALTLFDENAAILKVPLSLLQPLRRRDWRTLFIEQRAQWSHARIVLFGHALLEKLLQPRKAITAHVWLVDDVSDDAVASSLLCEQLTTKPFLPLPVLGVPGWCSDNDSAEFYEDERVFRYR